MAKPDQQPRQRAVPVETKIATILVPIDFSPCSLEAFHMAASVARRYDAEILLAYVVDTRILGAVERFGIPVSMDQMKTIRHRVRLAFRRLMASTKGVKIRRVVLEGAPFTEIMRLARSEKVDMIVIGAYGGRTGDVEKIFFGSTAEKVVRAAPCPVLTVPSGSQRATAGVAVA